MIVPGGSWFTNAMLLNVVDSGRGTRSALLIHGMCGSGESWGVVTDRLVDSGYRVLAVDLPGHGLSPRDAVSSVSAAADSAVETVRSRISSPLTVAMGHSYGGSVLAAAAGRLSPTSAVYVDAGMFIEGGQDRQALIEQYENDRQLRSQREWLRQTQTSQVMIG